MADVSTLQRGDGKDRRRKNPIHIDMTPMVDLAFLLLTFFMLTAKLLDANMIIIEHPPRTEMTSAPAISQEKVMTILLGEKDKVYWYQGGDNLKLRLTSFSKDGIRKILSEKNQQIKGMHVFIKPMEKSRYKNIVDIFDEITTVGIKNFSIAKVDSQDRLLLEEMKLQVLN